MSQTQQRRFLKDAAGEFDRLIGRLGYHGVVSGEQEYIQPYVYLSLHLVEMRAAGWDVDFEQLAAVSGASALFGYQRDEFMPKYAHIHVEPHRRISEATGFGYEWVPFEGPEGAWARIVESVDAGHAAKGWDWENILFAGYQAADEVAARKVYAMADGPDTYARWLSWTEFVEWANRMGQWKSAYLGRHTARVEPLPAREIALRVMGDLVAWNTDPPQVIHEQYPKATFGLAGIDAYVTDMDRSDLSEDWVMCHPINGQWGVRSGSSVYLGRVAEEGLFPEGVNAHLHAAAASYRAAYEKWQAAYRDYLGHDIPEERRKTAAVRGAAVAYIRAARADEERALTSVAQALDLVG